MLKIAPRSSIPVLTLVIAATTMACVQTSRHAEAAVLRCDDLGGLLTAYQTVHYSVNEVSPEVQARVVDQFLEALDPSRTLFLQSDIDRLAQRLRAQFHEVKGGDCAVLDEAFALVRERAAEDTARAKRLLTKTYKVDESVELTIDPEVRGYAKTKAERDVLGASLIHFQMANYLNGGISPEKSRKQLVHRYELTEKRLEERARDKRLPELFAEAFATSLDPHTSYLSFDALMDFQIHMKLSLEGIGAALRTEDGFTYIESLIPGGGAEKSGKLRPKDKIIAVTQDGKEPVSTIDMAIRDVVKLIRGKKGTKVTLTILRDAADTRTFDVTIVRDKIDVKQQAAKLEMKERKQGGKTYKVGVLELPSFYGSGRDRDGRSSYEDVRNLLKKAKQNKADALVLDLSRNGGGYLEDAVRISGLFLRKGAIVATRDTDGDLEVLEDTDAATDWSGPLVVLISPMSASASEILAGALQAYGRAVVVGADRSSFGKGSVQTLRPLPRNLGAMKVTTGMYFLPSGRSTQKTGVEVDIVVPSLLSAIDMGEKDLDYALAPQSTRPFRSQDVNSVRKGHWEPVTEASIAALGERSRARITQKELFREIEAEIAKAEDKKDVIKLKDLMAEADKDKSSEEDDEDGDEVKSRFERLQAAFVGEAVDIALDLAHGDDKASLGARTPKKRSVH